MHHLSIGDRFLFLTAVGLGVLGGILGIYLLIPFSLIILYRNGEEGQKGRIRKAAV